MFDVIADLFVKIFSPIPNYPLRRLTARTVAKILKPKYRDLEVVEKLVVVIKFNEFEAALLIDTQDSIVTIHSRFDLACIQDRAGSIQARELFDKIMYINAQPMLSRVQVAWNEEKINIGYSFTIESGITPNQLISIVARYHVDILNIFLFLKK